MFDNGTQCIIYNGTGNIDVPFKSYRASVCTVWRDARPILSEDDILIETVENNVMVM